MPVFGFFPSYPMYLSLPNSFMTKMKPGNTFASEEGMAVEWHRGSGSASRPDYGRRLESI